MKLPYAKVLNDQLNGDKFTLLLFENKLCLFLFIFKLNKLARGYRTRVHSTCNIQLFV